MSQGILQPRLGGINGAAAQRRGKVAAPSAQVEAPLPYGELAAQPGFGPVLGIHILQALAAVHAAAQEEIATGLPAEGRRRVERRMFQAKPAQYRGIGLEVPGRRIIVAEEGDRLLVPKESSAQLMLFPKGLPYSHIHGVRVVGGLVPANPGHVGRQRPAAGKLPGAVGCIGP